MDRLGDSLRKYRMSKRGSLKEKRKRREAAARIAQVTPNGS
jgi:hypothetical protein